MRRKHFNNDTSYGLTGTLFEPTGTWTPVKEFPNFSGIHTLGLDTETHDPLLIQQGPGFLRGDARVVGISIATQNRGWYFPFDHLGGGNMGRENVVQYIQDQLRDDNRYIVGANLLYDLEALWSLGINVKGKLVDIQVAEALIDEDQDTYSLEHIAFKYLGKGKDENLLKEAASAYGIDPKKSLWKLPSKYVGEYSEWDAQAPLLIFQEQLKIIKKEQLEQVFQLEMELLPLIWLMRLQGIPVDLEGAKNLSKELLVTEVNLRMEFREKYQCDLDEWSGPMIAMLCDRERILYPRTQLGNPSFTADYLQDADHPLLESIHEIRQTNKFRKTFLDDWIMKWQIKGRIHPNWKQVARDDGGTRTGRFAAANPNPQQIPAGKFRKTGKLSPIGQAIRAKFISDTGLWCKLDYSQQEPRILTHFAALCNFTGAKLAACAYRDDPNMDFYKFMMEAANIDRRPAKDYYLGRCYGMGKDKFAAKINRTVAEAEEILNKIDERLPFIKEIADATMSRADQTGSIRTLLGRRAHFNFWEPVDSWKMKREGLDTLPVRRPLAEKKWPGKQLRRANTHKALNRLIQGSAADMMKAGMLKIWKELKIVPYLTMHDETGSPVIDQDQADKVRECAEICVELCVPNKADMSVGRSWR